MPFLQLDAVTIINTEQIARIRYLRRTKNSAEYRDDFGRKAPIPGTSKVVSDSHLILDFVSMEDSKPDFQARGDDADQLYALLREHIQVIIRPGIGADTTAE